MIQTLFLAELPICSIGMETHVKDTPKEHHKRLMDTDQLDSGDFRCYFFKNNKHTPKYDQAIISKINRTKSKNSIGKCWVS